MYLALYRKYRPRTFDDVISQPEIVTTLKNQIATGQNAHAYLFTGSRGTGKTTCAKILAMALNCKHPVGGNPCLECESCREIASGAATDIMEIDAASNNSVNDVHTLQEQLSYTPVSCKYRVYILDEVHMMTTQAFNALLKTIEEPPPHVIFIFATTELHKVPATILSRCQRFEFHRIDIADSSARLLSIAEKEGVTLTQEAADLISRISDGGMRDALSLLDRCIAVSSEVTDELVRNCAGVADNQSLYRFAEMIAARNIPGCIQLLEKLYKDGKDVARLMDELSGVFRDLMLYTSAPGETGLLSAMPHDYPEIQRIAGMYTLDEILHDLTLIQECTDGISRTRQRRTLAEMCFVKLCTGAATAAQISAQNNAAPVRTAPAPKPEFKPMGSEYTPVSDDKLKPAHAANLSKLHELFNEPEQKQEAPRQEKQPEPEKPAEPPKPTLADKRAASEKDANINKIHEMFSKPPEAVSEPAPKQETAPEAAENISKLHEITAQHKSAEESAPMPELNSSPAAPESFDFVPPPEEPPEEFIPPREFLPEQPVISAPAPQAKPELPKPHPAKPAEIPKPAAEPEKTPAKPAPEKKSPAKQGSGEYEKLSGLTPEEWSEASKKLSPLFAAMFDGAKVSVNSDGVLEIVTGNLMLQGSAGSRQLDEELYNAFGKKVRAIVKPEEMENAAGEEISAVRELLRKAEQLNIEVQYK